MEFKLTNPDTFVKVIEFNYDDLQQWIADQVEKYQNLVYTDETIKSAKEDRATLNNLKKSIDAARKDVKKKHLEAYNNFEAKVKNLLILIEEPKMKIDEQVKRYEENKKDGKRKQIESYFESVVSDLSGLLTFEQIFNSKWLNTTTKIEKVQKEIDEIIENVKFDLQMIKELKSEWEVNIIDTYLKTLDISAALREKSRLEERKQQITGKVVTPHNDITQIDDPLEEYDEEDYDDYEEEEEEEICTRRFWVKGTEFELRELEKYMKVCQIEYGIIATNSENSFYNMKSGEDHDVDENYAEYQRHINNALLAVQHHDLQEFLAEIYRAYARNSECTVQILKGTLNHSECSEEQKILFTKILVFFVSLEAEMSDMNIEERIKFVESLIENVQQNNENNIDLSQLHYNPSQGRKLDF